MSELTSLLSAALEEYSGDEQDQPLVPSDAELKQRIEELEAELAGSKKKIRQLYCRLYHRKQDYEKIVDLATTLAKALARKD